MKSDHDHLLRVDAAIWLTIGIVAILVAGFALLGSFDLEWRSFVAPASATALLAAGGWFYRSVRNEKRLGAILAGTAQVISFAAVAWAISYIAATAGFPLQDAAFNASRNGAVAVSQSSFSHGKRLPSDISDQLASVPRTARRHAPYCLRREHGRNHNISQFACRLQHPVCCRALACKRSEVDRVRPERSDASCDTCLWKPLRRGRDRRNNACRGVLDCRSAFDRV